MNWIRATLIPGLALACIAGAPAAVADAGSPALRPGETSLSTNSVARPPRRLEEEELRKLLTDLLNDRHGAT